MRHKSCVLATLGKGICPVTGACAAYRALDIHSRGRALDQDGAFNQLVGRPLRERKAGPRLAEAGGRPELDLALAGCAGGRVGRGLWAAGRLHPSGAYKL